MISKIKHLVSVLNEHRDKYYNESNPEISDAEYDKMFDELKHLERITGFVMSNSPTQTVGYEVKSKLEKVQHNHPMLSLDKTKSVDDINKFINGKSALAMLKMDGLTCSLRYVDGKLVGAETRGDGQIGENILHNAKVFTNIPVSIDYDQEFIVDGEAIITYDDFDTINDKLPPDEQYKNPRNLASGSVRQLDNGVTKDRKIKFIAWKSIKGLEYTNNFAERLNIISDMGFETVPYRMVGDIEETISELKSIADNKSYPIDGLVFSYNDVSYGESLGATSHHLNSQYAFKFADEEYETTLRDIEWSIGKTGTLTPVAIFDPVEIDGTMVSRASVHNVSILTKLDLQIGDTVTVYKANQIIPQIKDNLSANNRPSDYIKLPSYCPVCGGVVNIVNTNDTLNLVCENPMCSGKLLGKLSHFASRDCINIDGLSEATLEFLISKKWVTSYEDLYNGKLTEHKSNWSCYPGFGLKSVNKIFDAIEASRNTTLERFIAALSIPGIGNSASKTISKHFKGDFDKFYEAFMGDFNWTKLDDFGEIVNKNMKDFAKLYDIKELAGYFTFNNAKNTSVTSSKLSNKIYVITGSVLHFKNRKEIQEFIENHGGKVAGSVSSKTDYLVNNDTESTSGKNKKAKELGIPIISEDDLIKMAN